MDKQYLIRDDHIGIFKNFMPNELIEDYLNYFNKCEQQGAVYPRKIDETMVSGNSIDTIRESWRETNVALTYTNKPFIERFFKEVYPFNGTDETRRTLAANCDVEFDPIKNRGAM